MVEEMNEQVEFGINAQYLKDLSFENPSPVEILSREDKGQTNTEVEVEVGGHPLGKDLFECTLTLKCHLRTADKKTIFLIEVSYAGLFTMRGVSEDILKLLLFVECPRLLFPFVRNIIAQVTQESGIAPLFLKPIDFAEMLRQRMEDERGAPVNAH